MSKNRLKAPLARGGANLTSPSTDSVGSTNTEHPVFCLRHLSNLDACEKREQAALITTLRDLATQTWQQIQGRHRHKGGFERISIAKLKGVRLPDLARPHAELLAFRFDGMKPMLGLREGTVFRVFHLDRDFSAYNHS